jgi:PLP dependent protein
MVNRSGFPGAMAHRVFQGRPMTMLERYDAIRQRIARAEIDWERPPGSTSLVAVSKTVPVERIVQLLEAGHRLFGENYVQESRAKWPGLRERFPDIALRMIGPLQSNKARDAVQLFDAIETLDRDNLAREIAREIDRQGRRPALFVQVNTGEEPQKGGVAPDALEAFMGRLRSEYGLSIAGLMCIPPADQPPSPHFALLRELARENGVESLSMGMSADFEAAIRLGATHIRVGSAIFGDRA